MCSGVWRPVVLPEPWPSTFSSSLVRLDKGLLRGSELSSEKWSKGRGAEFCVEPVEPQPCRRGVLPPLPDALPRRKRLLLFLELELGLTSKFCNLLDNASGRTSVPAIPSMEGIFSFELERERDWLPYGVLMPDCGAGVLNPDGSISA
jgi:hypothetical protein